MDITWHIKLIVLVVLIFLSAFFSGSEVALFSIQSKKFKKLFGRRKVLCGYVDNLLSQPKRLLVTILVGNTIVNVAASIVAVAIALELAPLLGIGTEIAIAIQIVLLTLVILLFGELLPKVYASKSPYNFAKKISFPMYWVNVLIYPVTETIAEIIKMSFSKIKLDKSKTVLTKDEISELTEYSQEKGTLEPEEQELIQSIVLFRDIQAGEIMTPRVDIKAIPVDSGFEDVVNIINETGHSRFPLFEDDLDNVIGIIYAKDILPYFAGGKFNKNFKLKSLARKTMYVPKSKKISELLREFQSKKMHIAIVVDEYGGTAGLITLEDIIEEVVGEIWDEYDKEEDVIKKEGEGKYLVLGKTPVSEINEALNEKVIDEEEGFETIGGFVLKNAATIPTENYSFKKDNYKFTVKEVIGKRIKKVLIEKEED